jgi:uncharacterized membrane protein
MNERVLKRWLLASVVFNLFLAGGIAGGIGRWWMAERAASAAATAQPRGLRHAADELSADKRRAFLVGLRTVRRDSAASIEAARDGRQEVLRLLAAPQFDRAALSAALVRTREADAVLRTRFEASVVDFATPLSLAEREKLASGMSRRDPLNASKAAPPKP